MSRSPMNTYKRVKVDPSEWFDAAEVSKARTYQRPLTIVRIISGLVNFGLLIAVISLHLMPRLADSIAGDAWILRALVVVVVLTMLFTIVDLPSSIWTTFAHERKWGFSTQTAKGFVADEIKGFILGLVIQLPLVIALWWLVRATELWWLAGWAFFLAFSVLLVFLFPIVIAPIFNKFTPLEDAGLATRLRGLAKDAGMHVTGVQVMDASKRTRKDNAFFAGVGRSRRIVVFDNLLTHSHPIVASVVAHELGHWRRRHIAKSVAVAAVTSFLMFLLLRFVATWDAALDWAGVDSVADPAALPLVALVFIAANLLTGVLQSWISRAHERQADLDALEITSDYDAFIDCERALSTKNLIDLSPSWWRYVQMSHPAPAERLEFAKLWRTESSRVQKG